MYVHIPEPTSPRGGLHWTDPSVPLCVFLALCSDHSSWLRELRVCWDGCATASIGTGSVGAALGEMILQRGAVFHTSESHIRDVTENRESPHCSRTVCEIRPNESLVPGAVTAASNTTKANVYTCESLMLHCRDFAGWEIPTFLRGRVQMGLVVNRCKYLPTAGFLRPRQYHYLTL